MRLVLLLCVVAAGAPLLASAQFYCMTGIPCGNGCTMGDGLCINGRCFDRSGQIEWECMAPMRALGTPFRLNGHDSNPSWMTNQAETQPQADQAKTQPQTQNPQFATPSVPTWQPWGFPQFPTFNFWRPWAWAPYTPFAPMPMAMPLFNDCGGKGPCGKGQFCDAQGVCRADDCVTQFKYGCPDDKGELKKIACPHFSGFKECYTSSTDGFRCFKGPSGSSIACATQSSTQGGGSVWTSSSGSSFQTPGFEMPDLNDLWIEDDDESSNGPASATPATGAGAAPVTAKAGGAAAAKPVEPAPAVAKPADPTPATAKADVSATGPAVPATATEKPSAFKKVSTEAGPAQSASKVAAGAATTAEKKQLAGATPIFLMETAEQAPGNMPPLSRVGPVSTPDGSTLMAAGPGPSIGVVDVNPTIGGVAAGMAAGDQKTVVTRRSPNSMSTMSSSVSTNGGPAIASSVATSGPYSTAMQVPEEWDIPPSTTASSSTVDSSTATQQALQPAVQPGSQPLPQQQGTAINSREGASRDTIAGTDTAKTTPAVKNSAGKGWRGGVWLLQSAVAGAVLLLLL